MSGDKLARPPSILEEIQQTKPFRSRSQEAYLALLRTADDSKRYISSVLDAEGVTLMTRPLCPYPEVAVWDGTGDTNDASSFRCQRPDAR